MSPSKKELPLLRTALVLSARAHDDVPGSDRTTGLSLSAAEPSCLHDELEKQVLRACGAQDDSASAFVRKKREKKDPPRWDSCYR